VKRLAFLGIAALLASACRSDRLVNPNDGNPAASSDGPAASQEWSGGSGLPAPDANGLRVMAYNVYLGTDLAPLLGSTTAEEFLIAASRAYAELQQTDFPARAEKIADQIAKVRPDVLGLEEVALWSVSEPYDPTQPPLVPFAVKYDFLQLVIDALQARGLRYVAASADTTTDVAAPAATAFDASGNPTAFALVRFQDREAVLVRAGVGFSDPRHGVYQTYLPVDLLGNQTGIYSGWSSVRAKVQGRTYRFVATHLDAENGEVNAGQAQELVGMLRDESDPVILAGDFNSGPGVTPDFAATYALITGSGFTDLWPLARPRDPGLTNGPKDGVGVLNADGVLVPYPTLVFDTRVDLVLLRDAAGVPHPVHAALFGLQSSDRTPSGLWPSDHAALGMVFSLPEPPAHRR
jgi:endonuclease/exonuclease/phosphatase family protein